jgi:bacteriorhodopsin
MRLYIIFGLIDLFILVAYPFVFLFSKIRQFFGFKR